MSTDLLDQANTDPTIRFHSGVGGDIKVYLNAGGHS